MRDDLVVRPQPAQQPDHFEVARLTSGFDELARPLFAHWQEATVTLAATRWRDASAPGSQATLDAVLAGARRAVLGEQVTGIDLLGGTLDSPRHFMAWPHGDKPLTSRLVSAIPLDATTARVTAVLPMP